MTGESLEVAGERYSQPLECTHTIPRASTGFEFQVSRQSPVGAICLQLEDRFGVTVSQCPATRIAP